MWIVSLLAVFTNGFFFYLHEKVLRSRTTGSDDSPPDLNKMVELRGRQLRMKFIYHLLKIIHYKYSSKTKNIVFVLFVLFFLITVCH